MGTEEILGLRHDEVLRVQRLNMSAQEIVDSANRQDLFLSVGPDTPEWSPESRRMMARWEAAFDLTLRQARITFLFSSQACMTR